jgi:SAM-dependent methyltransferase
MRYKKQTWNDKRFKFINWKQFKGKSVLDLGCEKGLLALKSKLEGAKEVVGIEICPRRVELAKAEAKRLNLDVDFQNMDMESDEFKNKYNKKFDFIFFCAITSHMKDKVKMIRWVDEHTKRKLFYETNFHHEVKPHLDFLKEYTSFYKFSEPIDIGDIPGSYHLIICGRNGNDLLAINEKSPIEMIRVDRIQPRKEFKKLKIGQQEIIKKLSVNIAKNGIVVPLIITKKDDNYYRVIEGGHRIYVAQLLNMELVPCKIVEPLWKLQTNN